MSNSKLCMSNVKDLQNFVKKYGQSTLTLLHASKCIKLGFTSPILLKPFFVASRAIARAFVWLCHVGRETYWWSLKRAKVWHPLRTSHVCDVI